MSRRQYVDNALLVLRARLDTEHPAFDTSPEVHAALASIRDYMCTWVLPVISVAAGHDAEMREHVNRDAFEVRKVLRDHVPHPELALKDENKR